MKTPFGWPTNFRLFNKAMNDRQASDYAESSPWMQRSTDGYTGTSLSETFFGTYDWVTWTPIATELHESILEQGANGIEVCEGSDELSAGGTADAIELCSGNDRLPGQDTHGDVELCEGTDKLTANSADLVLELCSGNDGNRAPNIPDGVELSGKDPVVKPGAADSIEVSIGNDGAVETCAGSDWNAISGTVQIKASAEQIKGGGTAIQFIPPFWDGLGMTDWMLTSSMLGFHLNASDAGEIGIELVPQYGRNTLDFKSTTSTEKETKARAWFDDGTQTGFGFLS